MKSDARMQQQIPSATYIHIYIQLQNFVLAIPNQK